VALMEKYFFLRYVARKHFIPATDPFTGNSGNKKVAEKMLALPKTMITEMQSSQWKKLADDLPAVAACGLKKMTPLLHLPGNTVIKQNIENPELYACVSLSNI
jgi:hypothetical protein